MMVPFKNLGTVILTMELMNLNGVFSLGTRKRTERLISDCSMPNKEMLAHGSNADTSQMMKIFQSSTEKPTDPSGTQFATQLKPLSLLNPDISYLSFAYNGLI